MNPSTHLRIEIPKPTPSPEDPKLHPKTTFLRQRPSLLSLITLFFLIVSFILYFITLKGCPSRIMMECVPLIVPLIPLGILLMWLCTLLITLAVKLILQGLVDKRYFLVVIVEVMIIWTISYGTTFQNHGAFNKAVFVLFLILNCLLVLFIQFVYNLAKKKPRAAIILGSILLLAVILQTRRLYHRASCEQWDKGLKGTQMVNIEGSGCEIPIPQFCFHELTSEWFDLAQILRKDTCSAFSNDIKLGQGSLLGFPKTEFFNSEERFVENYQKHVLSLVQPITEEDVQNGLSEVYLNQTIPDSEPTLVITVHRNESLVERSNQILRNKEMRPKFPNILTIYLDSVSRQHFRRKLPRTYDFIEKRYLSSDYQHESFQFFKYHASGAHTLPNQMRAFYGVDYRNISQAESIVKVFKSEGYITCKSTNLCSPTYFDVSQTERALQDFEIEPFDHENIAFSCDPNYRLLDGDGPYSYMRGSAAMVRRCLYGRDVHSYVLEYGDKFWRAYKDEPKFLELDLLDGHEPSAEVIKFLDEPLEKFLTNLEQENLLKDTTIVFYADHGHHLNFFYYLFGLKDLFYELKLPMLFILFPKNEAKEYGDRMRKIENVLVSGYDIYNFYKGTAGKREMIKLGIDFFDGDVDVDAGRNWKDIDLEENINICKER